MKTAIALLALLLGATLPFSVANASEAAQGPSLQTASQNSDLSAAKKRYRKVVYVYPGQQAFYYPPAFSIGDPSWQSPELLRRRAIGECVIDLGYGRYESCNGRR